MERHYGREKSISYLGTGVAELELVLYSEPLSKIVDRSRGVHRLLDLRKGDKRNHKNRR